MIHPTPTAFPRVAATHCTCCKQPLPTGEGFEIALLGVFGPVCILKFAPLGAVLAQLQNIESRADNGASMELGYYARKFLMGLGWEAVFEDTAEGVKTLRIGKLGHRRGQYPAKLKKVLADWRAAHALMQERVEAQAAQRARYAAIEARMQRQPRRNLVLPVLPRLGGVGTVNRLTRLMRLRYLAMISELAAEPCTPERAIRARRADRIAAAYRAEAKRWEARR